MDTRELVENLKAELTCSICLGYFTDPVTVKCGHNFCLECLLRCLQEANATLTCPVCRGVIQECGLVVNRNLQSLSITAKMLRTNVLESTMGLSTCSKHGKKDRLFCEEDQRFCCEMCSLGPEHKDHQVLPLQTAVQKCKEKLQKTQSILKKKEEEYNIALGEVRRRRDQCEKDVQVFKHLVISEYEKIFQLLKDEENLHLKKLDEELRNNFVKFERNDAKLSQQIKNREQLITIIEDNLAKETLEMLRNLRGISESNEKLLPGRPEVARPGWTPYHITGLREMLLKFHRDITLDPETANPHLILSEDLKSVRYSSAPQDLPDNEERFDCSPTVLGTQTFTSGKHYWEVDVGEKTEWEVGICIDSISRKGKRSISPEVIRSLVGFQAGNDFFLWNSQDGFRVSRPISKVGIFLDYEKGQIVFYNAIDSSLIYSPPDLVFEKPVRPCFSPSVSDEGSTPGSLIICPRNNQ